MISKIFYSYIKKAILLFGDCTVVVVALATALWLRVETSFLSYFESYFLKMAVISVLSYGLAFYLLKTYRTIIRLANLHTALRIVTASSLGALIFFIVSRYGLGIKDFPRSVYLIHLLLIIPGCLLMRFSWRIYSRVKSSNLGTPTLIYGAGLTTDRFLPFVLQQKKDSIRVIGIIDDNPQKRGSEIQGVKVFGGKALIPSLKDKYDVQQVILAMPALDGLKTRKIATYLRELGLKVQVLPAVEDYLNASNQEGFFLRDLHIEDLLKRAPRSIDKASIAKMIKGKNILVTGGGGSIGSELVRQIAMLGPRALIINDASEFALYEISEQIKNQYKELEVHSHLGDISNPSASKNLFQKYQIDIVFHASAYKHVPLAEENISSTILNNILSAKNIFSDSVKYGVERVVLISSDKAVKPTNVMGATKRICELLALLYADSSPNGKTAISCVRFGNVLASSGSVLPRFIDQIKMGGPVTVTHPDITRYFMLIPEAVSLVLQAATTKQSGEIFVLNMGEPVKIVDMARELIKLMGRIPDEEIAITYTGLRPGEKLYEELNLENEDIQIVTEDFFKLLKLTRPRSDFESKIDNLLAFATSNQCDAARRLLFSLVQSYETNELPILNTEALIRGGEKRAEA